MKIGFEKERMFFLNDCPHGLITEFEESKVKVGSLHCQDCIYNNGIDEVNKTVDCLYGQWRKFFKEDGIEYENTVCSTG